MPSSIASGGRPWAKPSRGVSFIAGLALVAVAASAAILAGDDRDRICRPGFAAAGRPDSDAWLKMRQQVFAAAGVDFAAHRSEYETDHVVPRCLDGPSTIDNLQLQRCFRWAPHGRCLAGPAADKDVHEREVCRSYCAGTLSLEQARGMFKRD